MLRRLLLAAASCAGAGAASTSTSTWLPGQKTVMIWCGVSTNATAMDEYGAYLSQNADAITAIAPTIWHLAQDSQSLTADDAIMAATAKLKKQSGVRVIPTVFDNESYNQGTLKPRLLKLFANPHKFINAIVNASVFYDFDGVNLDFEPRWKASPSDRAGLLNFVNELSDAMHKVGKVVSIDAAPCVNPSWQVRPGCRREAHPRPQCRADAVVLARRA